jgi:hypothetical protein
MGKLHPEISALISNDATIQTTKWSAKLGKRSSCFWIRRVFASGARHGLQNWTDRSCGPKVRFCQRRPWGLVNETMFIDLFSGLKVRFIFQSYCASAIEHRTGLSARKNGLGRRFFPGLRRPNRTPNGLRWQNQTFSLAIRKTKNQQMEICGFANRVLHPFASVILLTEIKRYDSG